MKTWEQIHKELSTPFPPNRVKTRPGPGGKKLSYIDARDVMDRLDEVVGSENWKSELHEAAARIVCALSVRVPASDDTPAWQLTDWITKSDGAGDTAIEGEKGACSDALKRAAVQFGIGRDLYPGGGVSTLPSVVGTVKETLGADVVGTDIHSYFALGETVADVTDTDWEAVAITGGAMDGLTWQEIMDGAYGSDCYKWAVDLAEHYKSEKNPGHPTSLRARAAIYAIEQAERLERIAAEGKAA